MEGCLECSYFPYTSWLMRLSYFLTFYHFPVVHKLYKTLLNPLPLLLLFSSLFMQSEFMSTNVSILIINRIKDLPKPVSIYSSIFCNIFLWLFFFSSQIHQQYNISFGHHMNLSFLTSLGLTFCVLTRH